MTYAKPPLRALQYIHRELKAESYPNTVSLALALEISRRTVFRYIEYLRTNLSAPVEYSTAKNGFYYSEPTFMFPSIPISEGELVALFLAEKLISQYKGTPYETALRTAFEKIASNLPEEVTINFADIDATYSFRTSAVSVQDIEIFRKVSMAAIKKRQIEILYHTQYRDEDTKRIVDPYHLINLNGEWYLLGYCHYRCEIRTFTLSRIKQVKTTGKRFTVQDGFDVSRYLGFSFGIFTGEEKYTVRMIFDGFGSRYIREKIWHESQTLEETDGGGVILTLRLNSLVEVKRWILSWGEHVEVLEPKELKIDMAKTAVWFSKKYSKIG